MDTSTTPERSLAHLETIAALGPIPEADRIEVAQILGWKVVVKKGEFQVGDWCVYFEIDSILPRRPWSEFLVHKDKPDKPIRLKTMKLRKQLSQGLALPLKELGILDTGDLKAGMDFTTILGVEKWEPPIPVELQGKIYGPRPWFVPKTDEERLQNIPGIIQELAGIPLYTTVKMDGTSASYYHCTDPSLLPDRQFGDCSRNMWLMPSEGNTYWRMVGKYDLETKLRAAGEYVIQGEICGPSIQGNPAGLAEHRLFVFNVYDIKQQRYLNFDEFTQFCQVLGLTTVPINSAEVILEGTETVDELLAAADGTYPNGQPREGLVWRPKSELISPLLEGGRCSFKTVSNNYLLGRGE